MTAIQDPKPVAQRLVASLGLAKQVATVSGVLSDTLTYAQPIDQDAIEGELPPGLVGSNQVVEDTIIEATTEGIRYKVAASDATDHHLTTAGGVKLYVIPGDSGIDAVAFGADPYGIADSGAALQQFFNVISTNEFDWAKLNGTFRTSIPLTFGVQDGPQNKTLKIVGKAKLIATASMKTLLQISMFDYGEWESLEVQGTGGSNWSGRGVQVGVHFYRCPRATFKRLRATAFSFAGFAGWLSNSSLMGLGHIKCSDCGSGLEPGNFSLASTWSNKVNTSSSGSTNQVSTIDVATMPPTYITDETWGEIDESPFMVRINGRLHYITSVDLVNNRLGLFPWLSPGDESGTLTYVFGGGVYLKGADMNVFDIEMLDATRCGTGISAASLYGPNLRRLTTQFCGIGLCVGRSPSGASLGGIYKGCYYEGNNEDIILVMRSGNSAYNYYQGDYALNLSKCYCVGAPRATDGTTSSSLEGWASQSFQQYGQSYNYEKFSRNTVASTTVIEPNRRDQQLTLLINTSTFNLQVPDADINRLTGVDTARLTVIGTGANNRPTGTLTFNAPAGWTVNGQSSVAFSNFQASPRFEIFWRYSTNDIIVVNYEGMFVTSLPTIANDGDIVRLNPLGVATGRPIAYVATATSSSNPQWRLLEQKGFYSGAWAGKPTGLTTNDVGCQYIDTTMGLMYFNGASWVDVLGRLVSSSSYLLGASSLLSATRALSGNPTAFTVSAWVKTTGAGSVAVVNEWNSGTTNRSFYTDINGGKLRVQLSANGASTTASATGTATVNDGTWHHVAVVYNGTAQTVTLYIDGEVDVPSATTGTVPASLHNSTGVLGIGSENTDTTPASRLTGSIQRVAIYNVVLSGANVDSLYSDDVIEADLVRYYPMQETSGAVGYNTVTNGGHLMLTNVTHQTDVPTDYAWGNYYGYRKASGVIIPGLLDGLTAADGNAFTVGPGDLLS